jgi:hypothetical protein
MTFSAFLVDGFSAKYRPGCGGYKGEIDFSGGTSMQWVRNFDAIIGEVRVG